MHKSKFIRWFMLCSSFVMLLSMAIPHHHHADGTPCVDWNVIYSCLGGHAHAEEGSCCGGDGCCGGDPRSHHHDCGCTGHNIALSSNENSSEHDGSTPFLLVLLCVLFDSCDFLSADISEGSYAHRGVYAEILYDACASGGAGLRGPPYAF